MKYERQQDTVLITFEREDNVEDWLLEIAQHSYDTAQPRGLKHSPLNTDEEPDLEKCIEYKLDFSWKRIWDIGYHPLALKMDYINNRDCRTFIQKRATGIWYFNAHIFEQRKVTPDEFQRGIRKENAGKFLDEVIHAMK